MTWLQRYRIRHYLVDSIWILPIFGILAAIAAVRLLHALDESLGWTSSIHPDTVRAVLSTMASSLFTFIVFVSSALLVAVQLASAQLTPRIIALVFKDPVTRLSLSLFVFMFAFAVSALVRIQASVPLLTSYVAAYGGVVSLGVFLYLIDHVGKSLRPSGALRGVARLGRGVIENVYPRLLAEAHASVALAPADFPPGLTTTIPSPMDGVVLAVDLKGLAALAEREHCVIELVPQVGDHVACGDALFRVFSDAKPLAEDLSQRVALGQERTLQQDPTFAFRIMVDIASKGLSPAINDPTTAVLALDQIHHLLRVVGHRDLDTGHVRDRSGKLRLLYQTPDWEDFVRLAVTEIRHFGGVSIQVTRRLRAMLEDLIATLPEGRAALLRQELTLVNRSAQRFFAEPEDRALAQVSDFQGVGGTHDQKHGGT